MAVVWRMAEKAILIQQWNWGKRICTMLFKLLETFPMKVALFIKICNNKHIMKMIIVLC